MQKSITAPMILKKITIPYPRPDPCCLLAHNKVDGEIVDILNAVNDDCVAATHDWASLTAAMWPRATPVPELS